MPTLNRVQLIGRLGKDPESKFTPTGKKVAHFSLAVSNRWKDKSGETKESTEWVNIEAWGRLGEVCQEYLKKGSLVFLAENGIDVVGGVVELGQHAGQHILQPGRQ